MLTRNKALAICHAGPQTVVRVSAQFASASLHDSLAAIPLSLMTAQRVTNCYDLMDAADCSGALREHSRSLGHGHFDAEIPASDVSAFHFKNSFARSSVYEYQWCAGNDLIC